MFISSVTGVDDNGSGSAVLLEVALAMAKASCARLNSVIFVAFDWEEYVCISLYLKT